MCTVLVFHCFLYHRLMSKSTIFKFLRQYLKNSRNFQNLYGNPEVAKWAKYNNISTIKETEPYMQHSTMSHNPYIKSTTVTHYNR